jgi:hypothetical protein
VFLGSKKVHAGAVWDEQGGGADAWRDKMRLFEGERYEYVSEMVDIVVPRLRSVDRARLILASLASLRLTINAEYVSSVGTGPTDNRAIYGIAEAGEGAREAFGFMLTPNSLSVAPGMELGLEPMYGLWLMDSCWGFETVSAFDIPLSDLADAKIAVTALPDVEGAVLYYGNARGTLQVRLLNQRGPRPREGPINCSASGIGGPFLC